MSDISDSDSDYNENEKILLDKYRKRKYESDDENEDGVFNVAPDEYDSEDILADSDIEGQEEEDDDIPNEKAWGRNKKNFYSSSTDFIDPNKYNEKALQRAEFEGEEILKLDDEYYQQLDIITPKFFQHDDVEEEDVSNEDLNEKEIRLDKQEKHITANLLDEFKEYSDIYKSFLSPIEEKSRKGDIPISKLTNFVETFSDLILNYSTNILMYFLLKTEKVPITNHPILGRLEQYRELIEKLHKVFEEKVKSKIAVLLDEKESSDSLSHESKKKKLKVLQNVVYEQSADDEMKKRGLNSMEQMVKLVEKMKSKKGYKKERLQDDKEASQEETEEELQIFSEEFEKRPITYQMAKNKGLTPHRKKEQRNPRVKHRNKYKKAKSRRKGAVREVRNEGSRYGGEISGINANVLKGIKLKV